MQKNLNQTSKLLANTEEELKRCQYALKERDFIILEQKKAGMLKYFWVFEFFGSYVSNTLNILNRKCIGSSSMCFTVGLGEISSG